MPDFDKKFRTGLLAALGVLLLLAISIFSGRVAQRLLAWSSFTAQERQMDAVVLSWRDRSTLRTDPAWREVHLVLYNAVGNVVFSPDAIRDSDLRRLLIDLQAVDSKPIDLTTCDWLWRRLEQTGPSGADYIRRHTPAWVEAKSWLSNADVP